MSDFKIGELLEKYCGRSKNVIIPEGVKAIGRQCFDHNERIESVTIPASVEVIGDSAFDYCVNLKKVTIAPNSNLKVINKRAFCFTEIEEFDFPPRLEEIHENAFMGAKFKNLELNDGLRVIESNAFSGCGKLKNVFIPKTVYRIDKNAFLIAYTANAEGFVIYIEGDKLGHQWDDDWCDQFIAIPYFLNIKREKFKQIIK